MEQRLAKLEQKVEDFIDSFKEFKDEQVEEHRTIMTVLQAIDKKLLDGAIFRNRVKWTLGVIAALLIMLGGFFTDVLVWAWNHLPMHPHTHD